MRREFDYGELAKATDGFSPSRLIGRGSHGAVFKAVLPHKNLVVAVKKSSLPPQDDKLLNEISVLSSLPQSPHVVNFIGTSRDSPTGSELLVTEFLPNGSLHDFLHAALTPPPWPKRVEIALQLARAVQFLHRGKYSVIHRDIKPDNILFDSDWNPKLADFGLAVHSLSQSHAGQPAGTFGYLDPCYTTPEKLSTKNDVFSLGVVLLEIFSCRKAMDVSRNPASIVEWAVPLIEKQRISEVCDHRLALPKYMEGIVARILSLAARCSSLAEHTRPSIAEIVIGIESSFVARVRIPTWTNIFQGVVRRRRKVAAGRCAAEKGKVEREVSRGRMLLREILADVPLKRTSQSGREPEWEGSELVVWVGSSGSMDSYDCRFLKQSNQNLHSMNSGTGRRFL